MTYIKEYRFPGMNLANDQFSLDQICNHENLCCNELRLEQNVT